MLQAQMQIYCDDACKAAGARSDRAYLIIDRGCVVVEAVTHWCRCLLAQLVGGCGGESDSTIDDGTCTFCNRRQQW